MGTLAIVTRSIRSALLTGAWNTYRPSSFRSRHLKNCSNTLNSTSFKIGGQGPTVHTATTVHSMRLSDRRDMCLYSSLERFVYYDERPRDAEAERSDGVWRPTRSKQTVDGSGNKLEGEGGGPTDESGQHVGRNCCTVGERHTSPVQACLHPPSFCGKNIATRRSGPRTLQCTTDRQQWSRPSVPSPRGSAHQPTYYFWVDEENRELRHNLREARSEDCVSRLVLPSPFGHRGRTEDGK
eukprot:gene18672-biopygen676